jgi:hypothetical protein
LNQEEEVEEETMEKARLNFTVEDNHLIEEEEEVEEEEEEDLVDPEADKEDVFRHPSIILVI